MTTRLATLAAIAGLAALALTGCSTPAAETPATASASATATADADSECAGVKVIVDTGDLEVADDPSGVTCVPTDAAISALDALETSDVTTEGTTEWGDQVVCRVNGVPAADQPIPAPDGTDYNEQCSSMPAAFAYWAVWVRSTDGQWAYAQEGLNTLQLEPGESMELLFTLNDEPVSPEA